MEATETMVHPFERAGLGLAPFRVVGCETKTGPIIYERNGVTVQVGAPGQPMGCCDYCGQGIAECWTIKSKDGRTFTVGSDCVRKVGGAELKRQMNPIVRKRSHDKDDARIEAARAALDRQDVRDALAAMPSPNVYRAEVHGESALTWAVWMLSNAGRSGAIKAARVIEKSTEDAR